MSNSNDSEGNVVYTSPIEIASVIFGVRYEPSWGLRDKLGSVVDEILRTPGTPFGPAVFPLSRAEPTEHALVNDDNEQLRIEAANCTLSMNLGSTRLDDVRKLAERYERFVLGPLRRTNLLSVNRYGVVLRLAECRRHLAQTPVQHFLLPDFDTANSLFMRFTRKLPTDEALSKRDVNDYRNAIYTIEQTEGEGEVRIALDFQRYFDPVLTPSEFSKRSFAAFTDGGEQYFRGEFRKWLANLQVAWKAA